MSDKASRFLISLFCFVSTYSDNLFADTYAMPWEGPLERIMHSLTGPVAKVAGILAIAGAGLALAMNQSEGFSRTAIRIVFGLSIAFAAGSWGLALFGFGANQMTEPDGFEVPVHRSLTEPILFAGVPRRLATLNAVFAAAIGLGGQTLLAIPIGALFHIVFAILTKIDPNFFEVLSRNLVRGKYWSG